MHCSLDFLICLHSVKFHSALRCLCLGKGCWKQQGFLFPFVSSWPESVSVGLPDSKPFTFVSLCLEFRAGSLLQPMLHLTVHPCGTHWRIKGEQPSRAYRHVRLWCFGMLWFWGKVHRLQELESRPLYPPPPFLRASYWNRHSLNHSKHPCFCLIFIWYGETHRGNDKLACAVF